MTDTERKRLLKGLECHAKSAHLNYCNECPYIDSEEEDENGDYEGECTWLLAYGALELLKELPQWIPVEEKLPRSMANKVIVYAEHEDLVSRIGYGHYEKYKGEEIWYDLETNTSFITEGYTVTHWMPMPKSPEGEELILS